jgi:hypothetical protein
MVAFFRSPCLRTFFKENLGVPTAVDPHGAEANRRSQLRRLNDGETFMPSLRIGLHAIALLAFGALMPAHPVGAQPSPAEVEAIRGACRSDFISHCMGVQPGGREALECLASHAPQLSAACGAAVSTVAPKSDTAMPDSQKADAERANAQPETPVAAESPAASAAAATPQRELAAVSKACTLSDVAAHCSFIAPNNPELVLCLRANATDLSPACHAVVTGLATPEAAPVAATPPIAPAPPAAAASPSVATAPPAAVPSAPMPPPSAAPTRRPTQQQIGAIRAACRSDFISHCSGVQPGGPEALQCLERSKAEVSSRCRTALAAVAPNGTPNAAPSTAPAPSAAGTPPAESFTMRPLRPREELAILRMCVEEARGLCGGVLPGGGRIISCLARNASQLSPQCRAAMAEARN